VNRCVAIIVAVCLSSSVAASQAPLPTPKPQKPQAPARDRPQVPPVVGTGVLGGVLLAADTGRPVRRAHISLSSREPRVSRSAITDTQGRFSFTDLPTGNFTLSASQPGYLDVTYGQKHPGAGGLGTPIHLADRQHLDDVSLRIPRGGVLTGTVTDDNGDAVFGAQVRSFRSVMRSGERTLEPAGNARTDDRGVFRIPALPPGEYLVSATPRAQPNAAAEATATADAVARTKAIKPLAAERPARATPASADSDAALTDGFAPVFYPGTTTASAAQLVSLEVSQERAGVDVQLRLVPMARIDGALNSPSGLLPPGTQLELIEADAIRINRDARTARPGADGAFSFAAVPPGRYTVFARATVPVEESALAKALTAGQRPDAAIKKAAKTAGELQAMWAMAEVTVDGRNVSGVSLALHVGMSVSGRLTFTGMRAPPTDLTRLRVSIEPLGRSVTDAIATTKPALVGADGAFAVTGVLPGSYQLKVTGLAGTSATWTLATAIVGGRDALDTGLEVRPNENVTGAHLTMSDQSTQLSGTLQDAAGAVTADYFVVVFSSDHSFWTPPSRRIQATRPGTDGHFAFRNLPPGDYRVIALADIESGAWLDPALLRQWLGAAVPLSLAKGAALVQDLRISR